MTPQERQIIDDLFDKLREVERQGGPREPMAEAHIRSRVEAQPGAPYYMAQTILMQEEALRQAKARIEELERELASRPAGGGFLASLFGGPARPQPRPEPADASPYGAGNGMMRPGTPWGAPNPAMGTPAGRGGFLAGAAQTAMGVAGGMMLGSMLGSMFGGGSAQATEAAKPQAEPAAAEDSNDDFGSDFSSDL